MRVGFEESEVVSEEGKDARRKSCKLCEQQLTDGGGTTNLYCSLASCKRHSFRTILIIIKPKAAVPL